MIIIRRKYMINTVFKKSLWIWNDKSYGENEYAEFHENIF